MHLFLLVGLLALARVARGLLALLAPPFLGVFRVLSVLTVLEGGV